MLLPALAAAKDRAVRVICMNNNRQLALGAHMYATDNQDFMPSPHWGNASPGWLYTPVGGQPPDMTTAPYATNPQLAYEGGQIWPYIRNMKVYWCPVDKTNAAQNPYWSRRANKQSTYIWNGAVNGYGALGARTYKQGAFKQDAYFSWEPDEANYYAQWPGLNYYGDAAGNPSTAEGLGRRHGKKGGILVGFSGHVVAVSFEKFNQERLNGPGLLWCVPGSPWGWRWRGGGLDGWFSFPAV